MLNIDFKFSLKKKVKKRNEKRFSSLDPAAQTKPIILGFSIFSSFYYIVKVNVREGFHDLVFVMARGTSPK